MPTRTTSEPRTTTVVDSPAVWPWVLLAIVAIAVLWWAAASNMHNGTLNNGSMNSGGNVLTAPSAPTAPAVPAAPTTR